MNIEEIKEWINRKSIKGKRCLNTNIRNSKEIQSYLKSFTLFLDESSTYSQRMYHIMNDLYEKPKCKHCEINETQFRGEYLFCCSVKCAANYSKRKEKIKETSIERYGVDNYWKSNEFKEKYHQISKEKYGVDHYLQSDDFKNKSKNTCLSKFGVKSFSQTDEFKEKYHQISKEKYGVDHYMQSDDFKNKSKESLLIKYGVNHQMQSDEIKEKVKLTMNDRYGKNWYVETTEFQDKYKITYFSKHGVDHPMQNHIHIKMIKEYNLQKWGVEWYLQHSEYKKNYPINFLKKYGVNHPMKVPEFRDKNFQTKIENNSFISGYKYKDYILPSGKIVRVQGYEPFALDILFQKFKEDEILIGYEILKHKGKISYFKDKERNYIPDIYIIPENKIIEVKSVYTLNTNLGVNILKMKACESVGLNFEFWVFDPNKTLTID